jgi:2-isopropylmalate synthase
MPNIELYDATLRDGMGGGGMSLTVEEKLRVVHALDSLGVHLIEAGFPASNPKERELFELLAHESLAVSEIVAFGMTRRVETTVAKDEGLRVLADSFAPVCTIVGKSSRMQVETVLRASYEDNIAMIGESVKFLVAQGKRVIFDAEHFFDGYASYRGYALDTLRAAAFAGAERLVLCDTCPGTCARSSTPCASTCPTSPSASTPTTTPVARSPTPWWPSKPAPPRSRER